MTVLGSVMSVQRVEAASGAHGTCLAKIQGLICAKVTLYGSCHVASMVASLRSGMRGHWVIAPSI